MRFIQTCRAFGVCNGFLRRSGADVTCLPGGVLTFVSTRRFDRTASLPASRPSDRLRRSDKRVKTVMMHRAAQRRPAEKNLRRTNHGPSRMASAISSATLE